MLRLIIIYMWVAQNDSHCATAVSVGQAQPIWLYMPYVYIHKYVIWQKINVFLMMYFQNYMHFSNEKHNLCLLGVVVCNARYRIYLYTFSYYQNEDLFQYVIFVWHYDDVIMTTLASQITSLTIVYSIVYSGVDQRRHQSSASMAFVRGIHRDRWIPRTKGQ